MENMEKMEKIDFVIPWVDGSDPEWLATKAIYESSETLPEKMSDANAECRYRDNGLLRFWFRGAEQFAPWVNKIHFVTDNQIPSWLNTAHPKLHIVNHSDFIPRKYLPTYNSGTIEMNFHRIEGLSEHYVFFNDDTFLLKTTPPECFFKNGNPVLETDLRYSNKVGYNHWSRRLFNDYCVLNSSFDTRASIWEHRDKWFSVKELGIKRTQQNLRCFWANKTIPVGLYGHLAQPHLKSTLQELWDRHPDVMDVSCGHKFRSDDQVNQWLLCAWNQAKGCFFPIRSITQGRHFTIMPAQIGWICQVIKDQEYFHVCLNESGATEDAVGCLKQIVEAFACILPNKSSFEKS